MSLKVKGGFLAYIAQLTRQTRTARFTISEVAVDWQEPVVLLRYVAYPSPALTDCVRTFRPTDSSHMDVSPHGREAKRS